LWQLTYAKDEEALVKLYKQGKSVPAIESKPELFPELLPIWRMFNELSLTCGNGFGGLNLSPETVEAYCRIRGMVMTEEKYDLILAMYRALLDFNEKKRPKPKTPANIPTKPRGK